MSTTERMTVEECREVVEAFRDNKDKNEVLLCVAAQDLLHHLEEQDRVIDALSNTFTNHDKVAAGGEGPDQCIHGCAPPGRPHTDRCPVFIAMTDPRKLPDHPESMV